VLPELFTRGEEDTFRALRTPEPAALLSDAVGTAVAPLFDGAELAVKLRRTRAGHLGQLRQGLPRGTNLLYVPELFHRSHGVRATRQVADALGAELGY
jgi:hypothetical protein